MKIQIKILLVFILFMSIFISKTEAKYIIESRKEIIQIKKADSEKPIINERNYDIDYEIFNTSVTINYSDNIGIKYAKYWFNPTDKSFNENSGIDFISNLTFQMDGWYKIEVCDLYNQKTNYIFLIDKEIDELNMSTSVITDNGLNLLIKAVDKLSGIQKIEVFINDNLYKKYEYTDLFINEKVEELQIPIKDLPFYEETYIVVTDFNSNSKISEKTILNRSRIYNIKDFMRFRDIVNKGICDFSGETVFLLNDLDLSSICSEELGSWVPIGYTQSFKGTFDGKTKTISNLYIKNSDNKQGLFSEVEGRIEELRLYGNIYSDGNYVGGITGINNGATIIKCYNYVNIYGNGTYVGGIAGMSEGLITKNSNYGSVYGKTYVGGLTGFNSNSRIEYCRNEGNIDASFDYVGGVAGFTTEFLNKKVIEFCYNSGNINGQNYVGGITGASWSEEANTVTIECVYNIGKISGTGNACGGLQGGTYYDFTGEKIKDVNIIRYSYNLGQIVNSIQINQISGGFINYTYCYYDEVMKTDLEIGTPVNIKLFSEPITNTKSVLYKLDSNVKNIWNLNSEINNGRVIFDWQNRF